MHSLRQKLSQLNQLVASPKFWLKQLRDLSLLLLLLFGVGTYLQRDMATGSAPALQGSTINGGMLDIKEVKQPTLVYFWGSWCPVCRVTSPMVETVNQSYPVISVAIASGTDPEINQYMSDAQYHFPVINDTTGEISERWGALALPAIYIVDANGEIRFVTSGATTTLGMKLRLALAGL
ncbi:protein disulfide oxidoreductase [Shewanella acanthi]|uniref:protein disulfide oxidoreductase n=1 Tax=Shewanella acanthi TaxID=2864212 RepID=UPI0021AD0855|nr:protein disulfide oxidoreductase [Shewanella acanthi]